MFLLHRNNNWAHTYSVFGQRLYISLVEIKFGTEAKVPLFAYLFVFHAIDVSLTRTLE